MSIRQHFWTMWTVGLHFLLCLWAVCLGNLSFLHMVLKISIMFMLICFFVYMMNYWFEFSGWCCNYSLWQENYSLKSTLLLMPFSLLYLFLQVWLYFLFVSLVLGFLLGRNYVSYLCELVFLFWIMTSPCILVSGWPRD